MHLRVMDQLREPVAVGYSSEPVVLDMQSALELMQAVRQQAGCNRLALNREAVGEAFFHLRTGLAGEVLQRFTNDRLKVAIYGDFFGESSRALQDFISESDQGANIFFTATAEEAVHLLEAIH